MFEKFVRCAVFAGIVTAPVFAATVNLSTGQDGGGTIQTTTGAVDANWFLEGSQIVADGTHAEVVNAGSADWFGGWAADGPNSSWVAANPSTNQQGPVPYSYEYQFTLTAAEVATASLSAATWGVDDTGILQLNGTTISGPDSFNTNPGAINSFAGTSTGFVTGLNTLAIVTTGTDDNLEAGRYEGSLSFTPSAAAPEPASAFLLLTGLGAGFFTLRRRKSN